MQIFGGGSPTAARVWFISRRPRPQPAFEHRQRGPPCGSTERGARRLHADREEREPRLVDRVHMGDQRRAQRRRPLGRQRRRQREDVADATSGSKSSNRGASARAASAADVFPLVAGGGGGKVSYSSAAVKCIPSRLDRVAPALPRLDQDRVATTAEGPGERYRGEGVTGSPNAATKKRIASHDRPAARGRSPPLRHPVGARRGRRRAARRRSRVQGKPARSAAGTAPTRRCRRAGSCPPP